jgi:hypothetical protein
MERVFMGSEVLKNELKIINDISCALEEKRLYVPTFLQQN